ncbi:alpha/beta hydrolase [Bradyrhizobium sp. SZCCHNR2028]|uniref:alpha/beta hydrolase n=1 Tax=Bradyrhizobium sp. SZCCHNR2028 TaxID=3057382 RepID=UPI0028E47A40|nr:alpha/beta hydrolase [Bradyrhizobium sp. SZCCHNR2028]
MAVLKWLLIVVVAIYATVLAVLFMRQRAMLFPIPPVGRTAPDAAGFPQAEEHVLTSADGEKVIAWHVPAQPGRKVVLYFPGNGDFLAGVVSRFKALTSDGTGLVALSYRGYAGSSGNPSEQGLLQDAAAAYAFTRERYAAERIVAWGFSLGSGVAAGIAAERPIARLILEAPYTSTVDVASDMLKVVPVSLLMRDRFQSDQRIAKVHVPLLIMHGAKDPGIPIRFGERLFALAHDPKRFVRFPDGGHNDLDFYGATGTAKSFIDSP